LPGHRCDEHGNGQQDDHQPVSAEGNKHADDACGEPHLPPEVARVSPGVEEEDAHGDRDEAGVAGKPDLRETQHHQNHQQGGNDIPKELRGVRTPPIWSVQCDTLHVPSSSLRATALDLRVNG